jgi:ribosomal protein S27E
MKDNLNVDIRKNSTAVKCEECENETFNNVSFIRKISKLYTGSTSDSVVPVPTFQCSECKHINKEFTINFSK